MSLCLEFEPQLKLQPSWAGFDKTSWPDGGSAVHPHCWSQSSRFQLHLYAKTIRLPPSGPIAVGRTREGYQATTAAHGALSLQDAVDLGYVFLDGAAPDSWHRN